MTGFIVLHYKNLAEKEGARCFTFMAFLLSYGPLCSVSLPSVVFG